MFKSRVAIDKAIESNYKPETFTNFEAPAVNKSFDAAQLFYKKKAATSGSFFRGGGGGKFWQKRRGGSSAS